MKKEESHVMSNKERDAFAAAVAELLRNCMIDYFPEEERAYVYFHGPREFNVIQKQYKATKIDTIKY